MKASTPSRTGVDIAGPGSKGAPNAQADSRPRSLMAKFAVLSYERQGPTKKESRMTEIAKMTEEQIVEILRKKGWDLRHEDGAIEAAKDVNLLLTRTDGYDHFRVYGRTRSDVFFVPTYAGLRLNVSERTAACRLYRGDPPIDVAPLRECDFEGAVEMEFEEAGEAPLRCLIEGGGLELSRAHGFWRCDLFEVWPGELFIRKDLSGGVEPRGADACYFRVPAEAAPRLLELRLPLGFPGEDAQSRMASVVATLEEKTRHA